MNFGSMSYAIPITEAVSNRGRELDSHFRPWPGVQTGRGFMLWLNRHMDSVRKMSATRVSLWSTNMLSSFVVNSYRT